MTDPQTAADAAERVQRWLDVREPVAVSDVIATVIPDVGVRSERFPLNASDLAALLAERARMAAELERVRGERDEDVRAVATVARATGLNWISTMAAITALRERFADRIAALAASAAPDATGDTQTAERRADGLRDLTKLEGAQRGSQRDAVCGAPSHRDFGDVVPCELPDGHRYHRNGTREWMP